VVFRDQTVDDFEFADAFLESQQFLHETRIFAWRSAFVFAPDHHDNRVAVLAGFDPNAEAASTLNASQGFDQLLKARVG